MQYDIKKPRTKVQEEITRGVVYHGYRKIMALAERHLVMVRAISTSSWLCFPNSTPDNLQTRGMHQETGALLPELMQTVPGTPPAPPALPGDSKGAQIGYIQGVPPGYVVIHDPYPNTQSLNLEAYANDQKCNQDFFPGVLTDDGTSTS